MASPAPPVCLPGDSISESSKATAGPGTHIFASNLCASRCGPSKALAPKRESKQLAPTVSILRPRHGPLLPEVNNTVLARIVRLTPKAASCSILAIYPSTSKPASTTAANSLSLPAPPTDVTPIAVPQQSQFSGQIRSQDVRATEKDKVVVGEAFRVGDIVRAVVISLGDQRDYYLSTAGNEYGVLLAWSTNDSGQPGGALMEPISWQEMRDPVTGKKETRKVAKPI